MTVDTAVLAPRVGDSAFITARQEVGRVVALPSETTATVVAGSGGLEVISLSEVTLLPRAGALVSLADGTGAVWLAACSKAGTLTADLLVGESVIQRSFDPSEVDPARLVVNAETDDVAGLSAALVATVAAERAACEAAKKAETTLREKEAAWDSWRDRLVREAHSRAEDHDYCSEFDEFMEGLGLPGRTRDYDVQVSMTLTITKSARTADDAMRDVEASDIRYALDDMSSDEYEFTTDSADEA